MSLVDVKLIRMLDAFWQINNAPNQLVSINDNGTFEVSNLDNLPFTVVENYRITDPETNLTPVKAISYYSYAGLEAGSFILSPLGERPDRLIYITNEIDFPLTLSLNPSEPNPDAKIFLDGQIYDSIEVPPGQSMLIYDNGVYFVASGGVTQQYVDANFLKVDPSPDTEQTFIGDLRTRGAYEVFAISGSKTRLVAQGFEFTLTGSAFKALITPSIAFTADREILLQDKDGTIALLSDITDLSDNVIHTTGNETKTGDLLVVGILGGISTANNQGMVVDAATLPMANLQGVSADLSTAKHIAFQYNGMNVMIGAGTPTAKLDVNGTGKFSGEVTIPNATVSTNAVNLGQLNALSSNVVLLTGESIQTVEGAILCTSSISAPLIGGDELQVEGPGRIAGLTTFEGGFVSKDSMSATTATLNQDGDLTVAGFVVIGEAVPTAANQAVRKDYVDSFQAQDTTMVLTPTTSSLNAAYPVAPNFMRVYTTATPSPYTCVKMPSGTWVITPGL